MGLKRPSLHDCPPHVGGKVAAPTQDWIAALADYLRTRGHRSACANAEKIVRIFGGGLVVSPATPDLRQFEAALENLRPIMAGRDAGSLSEHRCTLEMGFPESDTRDHQQAR